MRDALDRCIIQATQAGLPLVAAPYRAVADMVGSEEAEVIARFKRLVANESIRRIGAVPNHYALGLTANGMSVWDVADEDVAAIGPAVGALDFVTHCYERPRHLPLWPYNLFAMVHGRSRAEVAEKVARLASIIGPACRAHEVLYSTRLLKKTGLRIADRATPYRSARHETPTRAPGRPGTGRARACPRCRRGARRRAALSAALRHLPWRRPSRRDRTGAAAGKSRASHRRARRGRDRVGAHGHADARLHANLEKAGHRRAGVVHHDAAALHAPLGRARNHRKPDCSRHCAGADASGLRRRSAQPVCRGRDRRPSCDHSRRRSLRTRLARFLGPASRCMAGPSSRPTGALSISCRAMAGSPSTISCRLTRSRKSAPGSIHATSRSRVMGRISQSRTTSRTAS